MSDSKLKIGLIADHPNIVFEDVQKSLQGKFTLQKVDAASEEYPNCDIFLFASNKLDKLLITGLAKKIKKTTELLVISSHHKEMEVDPETRIFYYPYQYDIIINLPLIVKTVFSASQVKA
ncbi:MAG: hypothetical protein CMH26_05780 [Micavibrio sp.]|nr:hypothetical protein [Micavibrio sp.]